MPRLLVFDLDNTLLHSQIDFAGIRRDVTHLWHRENITDRSMEELRTLSIGEIIELGAPHDAKHNARCVEAAWQIVLDYERRGMSVATIEPDAAATLTLLRDGEHALAILTNNARLATLEALDKFELRPLFDLVLTRDEVGMKPAPDGLLAAQSHFAVRSDFSDTPLMIGDSWLDGLAAQRAAVPFLAFRPGPNAFTTHPVEVWQTVDQLSEIPPLLKS